MCEDRLIYLDLLRVAASFFVIMLHVSATDWASVSVYSWVWEIYNGYDSLVRWVVPAFVMISGCFFLNDKKEMLLKKLAQKYIWRLVKGFFFWSVLYAGMNCCIALYRGMRGDDLVWTFLQMVLRGHYHLWFIYMMIGLYLITPFLRPIARSKKLLEYFLILGYIFAIINPIIGGYIPLFNSVRLITSSMHMYFVLGYPCILWQGITFIHIP